MAILLLVFFYPKIKALFTPKTPYELIAKGCVEENIREAIPEIMKKGWNLNPELYFVYKNQTLEYLCYTREWYQTCLIQKPFLKQSIEQEIILATKDKINRCIAEVEQKLRNQGYTLRTTGDRSIALTIEPGIVGALMNYGIIMEKNNEIQSYDNKNFNVRFNSEIYELIMLGLTVLNFEATFGDTNTQALMGFYPHIKINKFKQEDGTKVYILNNTNSDEIFQFATRSLAWPPGLGNV